MAEAYFATLLRLSSHYNCRNSVYPSSEVRRFPVGDEQVDWRCPYHEYRPPHYESPNLKNKPWSDPKLGKWAAPHVLLANDPIYCARLQVSHAFSHNGTNWTAGLTGAVMKKISIRFLGAYRVIQWAVLASLVAGSLVDGVLTMRLIQW